MNSRAESLAIILAAGKGSRLDSKIPKALYKIDNLPMIDHIINSISNISKIDILTVVGHEKTSIIAHIAGRSMYLVQKKPNGTGDALMQCEDYIKKYENIFVFVGDAPFINSSLIKKLKATHMRTNADCSFLYASFPFALPYARLVFNLDGDLQYLVESNHANNDELKLRQMFTSHYLFRSSRLLQNLKHIPIDRDTKEYNLTDLINIYINKKLNLAPIFIDKFWRLMGVNTIDDAKFLETFKNSEKK